jgi:hypothetical protein
MHKLDKPRTLKLATETLQYSSTGGHVIAVWPSKSATLPSIVLGGAAS